MNKKYELALIFKPDLSEEIFNNEMENIKNMIDKSGAVIEKIDAWGKKKLAYEIKKFSEGNYNFIIFSADTNNSHPTFSGGGCDCRYIFFHHSHLPPATYNFPL